MMKTRRFLLQVMLALSLGWQASAATQGELRVGAARLDITSSVDPATSTPGRYTHERLYVRAIVLDNGSTRAALIGADQGGFPDGICTAVIKQLAAELACPVENIVMSGTHTHSAWGTGPSPWRREARAASNEPPPPIVAQIVDTVRKAMAGLKPARVGFGTGLSYMNVNRDAIVNSLLDLIQADNR